MKLEPYPKGEPFPKKHFLHDGVDLKGQNRKNREVAPRIILRLLLLDPYAEHRGN